MKIVVFGDIHGRPFWRDIIEKENDIIQSKELKKQFEILNFKLVNIIILVIVLVLIILLFLLLPNIKVDNGNKLIYINYNGDIIKNSIF